MVSSRPNVLEYIQEKSVHELIEFLYPAPVVVSDAKHVEANNFKGYDEKGSNPELSSSIKPDDFALNLAKAELSSKNDLKNEKAEGYFQKACVLIFSKLVNKLTQGNDLSLDDVRDLDFLLAPVPPFQHFNVNQDYLRAVWHKVLIGQNINSWQVNRVGQLLNDFLGTNLKLQQLEEQVSSMKFSLHNALFMHACNLEGSNENLSQSIYRRAGKSESRRQRLATIRANIKDQFDKLYQERQNSPVSKVETLIDILHEDNQALWRKLDGSEGRSDVAGEYCHQLVEVLPSVGPAEVVSILLDVLKTPVFKMRGDGLVGVSASWRKVEIMLDRAVDLERNTQAILDNLKLKPQEIGFNAAEAERQANYFRFKSQLVPESDILLIRKYRRVEELYREIARILRFNGFVCEFVKRKDIDATLIDNMDRMSAHLPSRTNLPVIWDALVERYSSQKEILEKLAFYFGQYLNVNLEIKKLMPVELMIPSIGIEAKQYDADRKDIKTSAQPSVVPDAGLTPLQLALNSLVTPSMRMLNHFFNVGCTANANNYVEHRAYRLKAMRVHLEKGLLLTLDRLPDPASKIKFMLACIAMPAINKPRKGEQGKSETARKLCETILRYLQMLEADLVDYKSKNHTAIVGQIEERLKQGVDSSKVEELDTYNKKINDFAMLLEHVRNNTIFALPHRGRKKNSIRNSEMHHQVEIMQGRNAQRVIRLRDRIPTLAGPVQLQPGERNKHQYQSLNTMISSARKSSQEDITGSNDGSPKSRLSASYF